MPNMSWTYRSYQWAAITRGVSDPNDGKSAGTSVAISIHSCDSSIANTAWTPNPRLSARSSVANSRSSGRPVCACRSAAIAGKTDGGTRATRRPSAADRTSSPDPPTARSDSVAFMATP